MEYKTDVLVVGTGGAGMRAAIESADEEASVMLVGKTLLGKAHTVMAEGGINAALGNVDPKDNWQTHFSDTIKEGQFINNWRMVEIMAKEAPGILLELENYGALFDRTEKGKIIQRAFGGHTYKRTCHIADRTGLEIMQVMMSEVRRRKTIQHLEEVIITKLLTDSKNKINGAVGISIRTGKLFTIQCKAIILATGGNARIYKRTTNAWETVGDGYALALDAGAELIDMEMVQFHPTGMVYPETAAGILVTESVRGEGGILLNSKGERFMKKYDAERMELSTRDVVSRAIFNEIEKGRGTKNGGVWLDISHEPRKFIERKLPKMIDKFRDFADVDITKEKMEVAPTAHYAMGGIRVDPETCRSKIKGLFAAGEIAGGVHGANRLGGNSLIDILVFGKRSGKHAAAYAKQSEFSQLVVTLVENEKIRLFAPFKKKTGIKAIRLKQKLQETMWNNVGIIRNAKTLDKSLKDIEQVKERVSDVSVTGVEKYNHAWIQYIELAAMLPTCKSIAMAALMRKESRGAHYRTDFPEKDDKRWKQNIIVKAKNGKLSLSKIPVQEIPRELRGV
ncbi:MAG: FAD-binding protein [Candidatus Aenigmarchaeota archaeon]|nr:FAD-binding protein [Candidatus Aenigmarchaeota archaeon]